MQKYKDQLKVQKRRKLVTKMALFFVVVAAFGVGLVYLLFFAGLLNVKEVHVNSPDELRANISRMIENWLDDGFWQLTPRNNILFFSADKLSASLAAQFPKLEKVTISKDFPHSLAISVTERKPVGIWCLSGQDTCFYFDKNGMAFEETQKSTGFLILTVVDRRTRELSLTEEVVGKEWLENILDAREMLSKIGVDVSEFMIPADSFDEFHAVTASGWPIYFAIATGIEKQINALDTFLKEKITPSQREN